MSDSSAHALTSHLADEMLRLMPLYQMSLRSERTTFSISFDAKDDAAAVEHVIGLIVKARAPAGASVKIVRPDRTEFDVSDIVADWLDRPKW